MKRSSSIRFTTACGKPLVVSEPAMKKAKLMYEGVSGEHLLLDKDLVWSENCENVPKNSLYANSHPVKIKSNVTSTSSSERAFKQVKKYPSQEKISSDSSLPNHLASESNKAVESLFANERQLKISEVAASTTTVKNLLPIELRNTSEKFVTCGRPLTISKTTTSGNCSIGFTTAGGKPLSVSEPAIKQAKSMYEGLLTEQWDLDKDLKGPKNGQHISQNNSDTISHPVESELNNTHTSLLEEASLYAEMLSSKNEIGSEAISHNHVAGNTHAAGGYSAANNKPLRACETALVTAKNSFDTNSSITSQRPHTFRTPLLDSSTTMTSKCAVGFTSASGKPFVTSKTAMTKAKLMYDSILDERSVPGEELIKPMTSKHMPENITHNSSHSVASKLNYTPTSFLSPHGGTSSVKEQIREKPISLDHTPVASSTITGFVTAHGKSLNVSEGALAKAKNLLTLDLEKTFQQNSLIEPFKSVTDTGSDENLSHKKAESESLVNKSSGEKLISDSQVCKLSDKKASDSDRKRDNSGQFCMKQNKSGIYTRSEMFETTDRIMYPKLEPQRSSPFNQDIDIRQQLLENSIFVISEEITASTEALLADEENSDDTSKWASAITCSPTIIEDRMISARPITVDESSDTVQELPMSPILGFRFRVQRKNKRRKRSSSKSLTIEPGPLKDVGLTNSLAEKTGAGDSPQCSTIAASDSCNDPNTNLSSVVESNSQLKVAATLKPMSKEIDTTAAADILEKRLLAKFRQEEQIQSKRRSKPNSMESNLLHRKMQDKKSRVSWRKVTNGIPPKPRTLSELVDSGIGLDVMEITAANASSYRFKCSDFFSSEVINRNIDGLDIGDGAQLVLDKNGYAGILEFERAFLTSPGVDPTLVPDRWIENHYRWIVWKLASMDRMNFGIVLDKMLTPHHVMEQLKYRYDREIDKAERSALRRIIERDDSACRRMVLCVATVTKLTKLPSSQSRSPRTTPISHWIIELTDGWYSIPATIDEAMVHFVVVGKVREGTKLITSRAELLNCDQGCYPLNIPVDASLKIHTNSTRRAKWDTKLGYCQFSCPISTSLTSILPNGGLIGKLNTTIARVYPLQYFERNSNGEAIFRNSKCEDKAVMMYENDRQAKIDAIHSQVRKKFEKQAESITSTTQNYRGFSGSDFERELESMLRESLPSPRKTTSVLKVRVVDDNCLAMLTIWAPSDDVIETMKEGNHVSIHNVQTSGRRGGELQLTAGRQSFVKQEKAKSTNFPRRSVTSIPEVAVPGFNPPYAEFDVVGIVVSLSSAPYGMKNFEAVNLAAPSPDHSSSSAYMSILFWEGVGAHGFSDILSVGSIVACTNIQWRRGAPRPIPIAYSTENSSFTRNPRQAYLRSGFDFIKKQIKDLSVYTAQCASQISMEQQKRFSLHRPFASIGAPGAASPSTSLASESNSLTPQRIQSPQVTSATRSSLATTPARYSIQRRLEKLEWYGEPPELSPVALNNSSSKVTQQYVPPFLISEH
ncbi:breast cancer type 2 susceptibility protein homolog [Athalia rosae]|uniref:breast cancer type 2 susceptibility protein homolog n=1 Tax=Athalia rosae TaxID=37344 RepID=UPI0020332F0F|nr:breast cancer type 2 susceptibility protein homolog [Athalia rosae]